MAQLTAQQAEQLDALLPRPLTPDMAAVALHLCGALTAEGVPMDAAMRYTVQQVRALADGIGGHSVYIPRGVRWALTVRDRLLVEQFTGRNHFELARRFGMSEVRVRQIMRRVERERFQAAQGTLF